MAHPAEVLRVLDGDTSRRACNLWPGLDITTRVRLRGIDAPEMKARCADERVKAEAARDALSAILTKARSVSRRSRSTNMAAGSIADASTRTTPDVSAALLEAGLARRYAGGRRDSWC